MSKKSFSFIAVIISIFLFGVNQYTDFDFESFFISDSIAPIIDLSNIPSKVLVDSDFNLGDVACTDNIDDTCTVNIYGDIDTSTIGIYEITLEAVDNAGNKSIENITIEVIDQIDTTMYVPFGYYDDVIDLRGEELKNALNDIITNHIEYPYTDDDTDVWDILRDIDEDPNNPNNVLLFYTGMSWMKDCQDTTYPPDYCYQIIDGEEIQVEWNREHIWSKSHGEFDHEDSTSYALGAHTDIHHLVPAERRMNSTKNNRLFDDCHDGINDDNLVDRGYGNYTCGEWFFEPRDEVKGDVARMLFYMTVRYEGEAGDYVDLELVSNLKELAPELHLQDINLPYYANLSTLLKWHIEDPVSERELERNQAIYLYQGNRNPFIDHPEFVELIFGTYDNPIYYDSITD